MKINISARWLSITVTVISAVALSGASQAQADVLPGEEISNVVRQASRLSPGPKPGAAVAFSSTGVATALATSKETGDTVSIPRNPMLPVTVKDKSGSVVGIRLPNTGRAREARMINGVAVYENPGADFATAAQPLADGSVRTFVTIGSPRAPREYRFALSLPVGGFAAANEDGSVDLVGPNGVTVAAVAPPWARDAKGRAIPTWFTVEGAVLVQHVDVRHDTAFPVVADPWVQGDCGWVTCTIRFDRGTTRNLRDAFVLIGIAAGACGAVTAGTAAVVCGAAIAPAAGTLALFAGRFYEVGNCLGIRVTKTWPAVSWPVQVSHYTYNCW